MRTLKPGHLVDECPITIFSSEYFSVVVFLSVHGLGFSNGPTAFKNLSAVS